MTLIHRVPECLRHGACALHCAVSSPSGEAARFPDRRQALGDCDKLATNAHVPLSLIGALSRTAGDELYPAHNARLEGVIAQLGAALWKVG